MDLSTTESVASRRIRDVLDRRNGSTSSMRRFSGREKGAREASLSIMVGGAPEVFARHKDLLSLMGSSVVHVGEVEAAASTKLVNNMIAAAAFTSTVEGFSLAHGTTSTSTRSTTRSGWLGRLEGARRQRRGDHERRLCSGVRLSCCGKTSAMRGTSPACRMSRSLATAAVDQGVRGRPGRWAR
ncbi:NAD(P)-binding domain-containing protein [Halomonas sp.]|uniref:NAD(P)-binding domain-containing protein n=1 Tax=Halomonas sp. TaxID=1486246 RepID=UPI003A103274